MDKKQVKAMSKAAGAGAALTVLLAVSGVGRAPMLGSVATASAARQTSDGREFYCNLKALGPVERAQHKQLTEKLIATRKTTVESAKGYEFQYSPSDVSVADLAGWATTEAKCCPFFDFHIDLEHEGTLVCLRLTGAEGIKVFIRTEFQVSAE
jgi:hypothetical protein